MKQNYRPTTEGLSYFEQDLTKMMIEELGFRNDNEYIVKSIDWYDWDDSPRWFVHIHIWGVEDGKWGNKGYVELDVYGYGGDETLSIEKIEHAGHGYPCISTTVANQSDEGEWEINEIY